MPPARAWYHMLLVVLLQKFLSANKPFDLRPEGRGGWGERQRERFPRLHMQSSSFLFTTPIRGSLFLFNNFFLV